ncbi:hypothetical protein ACTMTJ_34360 [Phytohabitans sp. LJ34]|uniref:hypothetical protein n=1 Tax=Phytohabitans sp. LJ34 TaxID=3452217 RepID=UPI003F8BAD12
MALMEAVDVLERRQPAWIALADTARSLWRTHATLPLTKPLTGHPHTDAAVATVLAAFPAALTRITARPGTAHSRAAHATRAPARRVATPTEAVACGIPALQRLAMRAHLYADELEPIRAVAWRAIGPLVAQLREFGQQCDTLSFHLRPARYQMEEALTGLDTIGIGRDALSHLTRSASGRYAPIYADEAAVEAFLAKHPERRDAFATHVARATDAYAHADAARDKLTEDLALILATVSEL